MLAPTSYAPTTGPRRAALALLPLILACSTRVAPNNAFDPGSPAEQQASGTIDGSLRGVFRTAGPGVALAAAQVRVEGGPVFISAADGSFRVTGVTAGSHRLIVSHADFHPLTTPPIAVGLGVIADVGELRLNDSSVPSAPVWVAPTVQSSVTRVNLRLASLAGDAGANIDHYEWTLGFDNWGVATSENLTESVKDFDVVLQANQPNAVLVRAVDGVGNTGAAALVQITHDDIAPLAVASLSLDPGPGRVDLSWLLDTSEPSNLPQASDRFIVAYGDAPDSLIGTIADQGDSPITATLTALRLSGLINGHPLYFQVAVEDSAGNRSDFSPPMAATPGLLTPVAAHDQLSLAGVAGTSVRDTEFDGRFLWVLDSAGEVHCIDYADMHAPRLVAADFNGTNQTTAFDVVGHRLYLASEVPGAAVGTVNAEFTVVEVQDPAQPVAIGVQNVSRVSCVGCVLGLVVDGLRERAYVVLRNSGVWRVDLTDGLVTSDRLPTFSGDSALLNGTLRLNGRTLFLGYSHELTEIGTGTDFPSGRGLLSMPVGAGTVPLTDTVAVVYRPTLNAKFVESFRGDGIDEPAAAGFAEVHGQYIFMPWDGSVGVIDHSALGTPDTAARGVGRAVLGLQTANSVAVAGGLMAVAHARRSTALATPPGVKFFSLANKQLVPGEVRGVVSGFAELAEFPFAAAGRMHWLGPYLLTAGQSSSGSGMAVQAIEVNAPQGPRPVASVGENPTGMNVGMGNYVVHQRVGRGTALWDVSDTTQPRLAFKGNTCIPDCFVGVPNLPGRPVVENGMLLSGMVEGIKVVGSQVVEFRLFVLDLVAAVDRPILVGETNQFVCGDSEQPSGFSRLGSTVFMGCSATDDIGVYNIRYAGLGGTNYGRAPDVFKLPGGGFGGIRWLAQGKLQNGGVLQDVLWVLGATGKLSAYAIGHLNPLTSFTQPQQVAVPAAVAQDSSRAEGLRVEVHGSYVYLLSRTVGADDANFALLQVYDMDQGQLIATFSAPMRSQANLSVYADIILLGTDATSNPYFILRLGDGVGGSTVLRTRAIAAPNPYPLDGLLHGGSIFSAAFSIFSLE